MARATINHASILTAVPLRNPLVQSNDRSGGVLRLTAPLDPTLLGRLFGTGRTSKSFDLDDLGATVWNLCDGRRTVEKIITEFASQRRINLREAQVAVATFLRTLLRRNLITLVGAPAQQAKRKKRKSTP